MINVSVCIVKPTITKNNERLSLHSLIKNAWSFFAFPAFAQLSNKRLSLSAARLPNKAHQQSKMIRRTNSNKQYIYIYIYIYMIRRIRNPHLLWLSQPSSVETRAPPSPCRIDTKSKHQPSRGVQHYSVFGSTYRHSAASSTRAPTSSNIIGYQHHLQLRQREWYL